MAQLVGTVMKCKVKGHNSSVTAYSVTINPIN